METWKSINSNYQVSNLGRVKNRFGRLLKPYSSSTGYLKVKLDTDKQEYVHRLVAKAFYGEKENCVVDHINGNKQDNRLANLEWVSTKENAIRSVKLGLQTTKNKPIIAKNGIVEHFFKSIKGAARILGISQTAIRSALASGYATNGYRWQYA